MLFKELRGTDYLLLLTIPELLEREAERNEYSPFMRSTMRNTARLMRESGVAQTLVTEGGV